MGDDRFSNLAPSKWRPESVSIADVAQDFVSRNENRKTRNFWHCGQLQKVAILGRFINILAMMDTLTRDDVYVIFVQFVEVVNKMARKCKINGRTLNLMFLCIGQNF